MSVSGVVNFTSSLITNVITAGYAVKKWSGNFVLATDTHDCDAMEISMCAKKPRRDRCEIRYEAQVLRKPDVCAFEIILNETLDKNSSNLTYYAMFKSDDVHGKVQLFELKGEGGKWLSTEGKI